MRSVKSESSTPALATGARTQAAASARDAAADRRFLIGHLLWPLIALAVLSAWAMLLGGDFWLADRFYAWQGGQWSLQRAFLTEAVIHQFGRDASTAAWLGVFGFWLVARLRPKLADWRRPLGYLLLASLISIALVSGLKSLTNMDCPWDLSRYGGTREFFGVFSLRPSGLARGICFPAGHASAGYGWIGLYFFFLMTQPRLRWLGLGIALGFGALFGFSQQLRGAHFVSHDVWTLSISWFVSLALYLAMGGRRSQVSTAFEHRRLAGDANAPIPQRGIASGK
ncbi:MAG: phosphatase PAP2 family protein [Lysobacter sp.]